MLSASLLTAHTRIRIINISSGWICGRDRWTAYAYMHQHQKQYSLIATIFQRLSHSDGIYTITSMATWICIFQINLKSIDQCYWYKAHGTYVQKYIFATSQTHLSTLIRYVQHKHGGSFCHLHCASNGDSNRQWATTNVHGCTIADIVCNRNDMSLVEMCMVLLFSSTWYMRYNPIN